MAGTTVDVRCYCHGLGDCMLVRLPRADGTPFWMLIDCGIHSSSKGGADKIRGIVKDIEVRTGGVIDVIVGTHEHWDHLSAFLQAAKAFAKIKVKEVWFSWAENPQDPDARKLDRFKGDAAAALAGAALRMSKADGLDDLAAGVDGLLGFVFGVEGEKVRSAREALRNIAPTVRHLEPGTLAPLPETPAIRAYVLGPPRDPRLLGIEDILSETYAFGANALTVAPLANGLAVNDAMLRVDDDPGAPFDGAVGSSFSRLIAGDWSADPTNSLFFWEHYAAPDAVGPEPVDQAWRRIDNDWLASSVDLALQLDGRTNNTSLVLALEIVETGGVLLFAADAQIGNWLSWPTVQFPPQPGEAPKTGDDLIRRTIFYKVGHHGSRNATRASALEQMDRSKLVAFSPTDTALASRIGWSDFPAPRTSARLAELTSGRYFQSDAPWVHDPTLATPFATGGALKAIDVDHGSSVNLTIG